MAILTPILFLIILIALGYLAIRTNRSLLSLVLQLQADRQAVDADRKAVGAALEAIAQRHALLKNDLGAASQLIEDHAHSIVSLESAVAELNIESINAKTARPHSMGVLDIFEAGFASAPATLSEPEKPKKKRAKKTK